MSSSINVLTDMRIYRLILYDLDSVQVVHDTWRLGKFKDLQIFSFFILFVFTLNVVVRFYNLQRSLVKRFMIESLFEAI